jgi:transcriptional regulator with XRE-family HTH domain
LLETTELKALGERLARLREDKGLSAAQVAHQALGYDNGSHVAVTRLERGLLAHPRQEHLQKLAAFYGVSLASLMAGEGAGSRRAALSTSLPRAARSLRTGNPVPPPAKPLHQVRTAADAKEWERARAEILRYWMAWTPGPGANLPKRKG